jgi:hypothetical protein
MYDHAMGHTVVGSGYTARIVIDQRGQDRPVDNPPVDNPSSEACAPPSLTWVEEEGKLKVESGCNYTPQAGRERFIPHQASSKNGHRRTAGDVERAMRTIRLVRALVNWTQRVPLRRLEFVLRPWTDRGWDAQRIAAELIGMVGRWKPAKPAEFIQSVLAEETAQQARRAVQEAEEAAATAPNAAFAAAAAVVRGQEPDGEVLPDVEEVPLSDGEIQELRDLGRRHPRLVVDYAVMAGEAAAVALYGRMLYDNAHRLAGATA